MQFGSFDGGGDDKHNGVGVVKIYERFSEAERFFMVRHHLMDRATQHVVWANLTTRL